ncbi:TIGR03643 family protein [Ferruginibacter sp. SUN106]|uniref:TIGR03643 family protein n=1 Tax=Ferruginibacter sp. SUN106 TaxID=2978348 RepID=UPI003D36151B
MNAGILNIKDIDRIIEMAWEDRTTFEAIAIQFGVPEKEVIRLMRREMKASSFKMWRKRTNGRITKHAALRSNEVTRFKCSRQKTITHNKISGR